MERKNYSLAKNIYQIRDTEDPWERDEPLPCQTNPNLFTLSNEIAVRQAITICNGCDLKRVCLKEALKRNLDGVMGGTTKNQRNAMKKNGYTAENI
jgi:hypothetical protein